MIKLFAPIALATAVVFGGTLSAQVPHLTDEEIEAAISKTKGQRFESSFVQARGRFLADFTVIVQGPIGRTMDLAREAFDAFKPVTAATVPKGVVARQITVLVLSHTRAERTVTNVVIMPPNAASRDNAIQPMPEDRTVRDRLPRSWRSGYGDYYADVRRTYRFDEAGLPSGDITIVVATNNGQETFTVRAQDRERIR